MASTYVRWDDQRVAAKIRKYFVPGFTRAFVERTGIARLGDRATLPLNAGDTYVVRRLTDETPEFYQALKRSDEVEQPLITRFKTAEETAQTIVLQTAFRITTDFQRFYDDWANTLREMTIQRSAKYARTVDRFIWDQILTTTSVWSESVNTVYAGGGSAKSLVADTNVPTLSDLNTLVRAMLEKGAEPWMEALLGTDQVGTSPLNYSFIAFADQKVVEYFYDNASSLSFTPVHEYPANSAPFNAQGDLAPFHEAGHIGTKPIGIRLFFSQLVPFYPSAGAGSPAADVFPIIIFGRRNGLAPFKVLGHGGGFRTVDIGTDLPALVNNFEWFEHEGGGLADPANNIYRMWVVKGRIGFMLNEANLIAVYYCGITGETGTGQNPYDPNAAVDRYAVNFHGL